MSSYCTSAEYAVSTKCIESADSMTAGLHMRYLYQGLRTFGLSHMMTSKHVKTRHQENTPRSASLLVLEIASIALLHPTQPDHFDPRLGRFSLLHVIHTEERMRSRAVSVTDRTQNRYLRKPNHYRALTTAEQLCIWTTRMNVSATQLGAATCGWMLTGLFANS